MLWQRNTNTALAYHIVRFQRERRLKPLDKYLEKEPKPKQSWEEQYALAQKWVTDAEKQRQLREQLNGR